VQFGIMYVCYMKAFQIVPGQSHLRCPFYHPHPSLCSPNKRPA
jgi:hypothetical protein